jgi:hypothetical protein
VRNWAISPKGFLATLPILAALWISGTAQPSVKVAPMDAVGPRPVEQQTQSSVVRDYLQAWQTLSGAMSQNRADLLDASFVGVAKDKLLDTIREQQKLGIQTSYRDLSHNLEVVFYSPEGLSLQLLDSVEYDVEVSDHGKTLGTQHVRTRYVAVLSPTESKWKVRVLQSDGLRNSDPDLSRQ